MNATHAFGQFLRTLPHSAAATFLALFPSSIRSEAFPFLYHDFVVDGSRSRRTALKTGIWVFVILVTFLFVGRFVLHFFGISLPVLKIAGGLIVANTAWGMVTSHARITPEESHEAQDKEDILAYSPGYAAYVGPGAIGVVMGLAANVDSAASVLGHGHPVLPRLR